MNIYRLVFFFLYKLIRYLGNKDYPKYGAAGLISGSEFFILMYLENIGIITVFKGSSVIIAYGLMGGFYYLNFLYLVKKMDYRKYEEFYTKLPDLVKILLIFISLLIVFYPFYLFINST